MSSVNMFFVRSCQEITSDKITDRKNSSKKLREFLKDESICKQMDGGLESVQITWASLFISITEYVVKQIDNLMKLENSSKEVTQSAKTTRNNTRMETIETMRVFLKAASSRSYKPLKIREILNHIFQMINHQSRSRFFLSDYSDILLNDILTCHKYIADIPQSYWTELLDFYCSKFNNKPGILSRDVAASIINIIIVHSSVQCDLNNNELYCFFNKNLKELIRSHGSTGTVIQQLLAAFNKYSSVAAPNARGRLCRIGEDGLIVALLLKWRCSSVDVKKQIVQFLWTQVILHHPGGSLTESEGFWAHNEERWGEILREIYKFVMKELKNASNNFSFTSTTPDKVVTPLFIDLTVNVMYQIFHRDINAMEPCEEPLSKKRKITQTWSSLTERISSSTKEALVIWLQVTSHMLLKWPGKFPASEQHSILSELQKLLKEEKIQECIHWLLICLRAVAISCRGIVLTNVIKDVWKLVWDTCLKLKFRQNDVLSLLTILIEDCVVEVDHDPWKYIFTCHPTRSLVSFIAALLAQHRLPESFYPSTVLTISDNVSSHQYPFRSYCLKLLLLSNKDGNILEYLLGLGSRSSVTIFASVLASLIQKSTMSFIYCKASTDQWVSLQFKSQLESVVTFWSSIETLYQHSALHSHPFVTAEKTIQSDNKKIKTTVILPSLCDLLFSLLDEYTTLLLQTKPETVDTLSTSIESSIYHFALIINIGSLLNESGLQYIKFSDYQAVSKLKELQCCVVTGLKNKLWNKNRKLNEFYNVIKNILMILHTLLDQSINNQFIRELLCNQFSQEILTIVHQLALDKYELNEATRNDDFETINSPFTKDNSYSPTLSTSSSSYKFTDIYDPYTIDESTVIQRQACEFVIQWYVVGLDNDYVPVINGDIVESWNIIEEILTDKETDHTLPKSVNIIFHVCTTLVSLSQSQLTDKVLKTILTNIRNIRSSNKRNQLVFQHGLVLLSTLTPHIGTTDHYNIELYKTMLSGFCNLLKESSLSSHVRCVLVDSLAIAHDHLPTEETLDTKEGDNVTVYSVLLSMLSDTDHAVRLKMVAIIHSLFSKGGQRLPASDHENVFINDICPQLEIANLVNSDIDPVSTEDESVNRICSMLCVLEGVAMTSVSCEQHVVSRMISNVGHKRIADSLIIKAIENIAVYLGFSSTALFLEGMVGQLVIAWLKEGNIEQFPYTVFGQSSLPSFLRTYYRYIIPHIMWSCPNKDILQVISESCTEQLTTILQQCLPVCMVFIITQLATDSENSSNRPLATSCYKYLESVLSSDVLTETMKHSLNEFVVELLIRLYVQYDGDSFLSKYMSSTDPCPFKHCYSSQVVQNSLKYISSCYFSPQLSFIATIAKKKDMIQSILLSLNLKLYSTHRLFQKKYILLSHSLFVRLVCQELKTGLGGSLSYVVMDIIYSMVRILDSHTVSELSVLFPVVCGTLLCLLKAVCKDCPEVLIPHYHILFSKLLPIAKTDSIEGKQALNIFKYLIEHGDRHSLVIHVTVLDPLPDGPIFTDIKDKLHSLAAPDGLSMAEVLSCFSSNNESLVNSEGLEYVHTILTERRSIVYDTLAKQDPKITSSPVIDFLQSMIVLSNKALKSENNRLAVTRIGHCFGDIGYMDIPFIALPQKSDISRRSLNQLYSILSGLLTDQDIMVVKETSDCLKALLSTQTGTDLLKENEEDLNILDPFRAKRKVNTTIPVPPYSITIPPWTIANLSHDEWLTQLVINLLNSGWVSNEALLLLSTVCKVKVELCQWVFPLIVHHILSTGSEDCKECLSTEIHHLLTTFNSNPHLHTSSIDTILDMLMYLRTQRRHGANNSSVWDSNFWLELDFLQVSKAAIACSSYFTGLLFLEIWYNNELNKVYEREASGECVPNPIEANPLVKSQFLDVYSNIGESDSIYGAIILYSPQEELRRRLYDHEEDWDKALGVYDWQSMTRSSSKHSHLVEIFKNLGLPHVLEMYVEGVKSTNVPSTTELKELQYESAWKYMIDNTWEKHSSHSLDTNDINGCHGFHSLVNNSLLALRQNEQCLFNDYLYLSRHNLLRELCSNNNQSVCRLLPYLTKFQCIQEMENFGTTLFDNKNHSLSELFSEWDSRLSLMGTDFQHIDLILSLRAACINSLLLNERPPLIYRKDQVYSELYNVLRTKAKLASDAGKYQIAEASLFSLNTIMSNMSTPPDLLLLNKGQFEEAELCWARGEHSLALMLMDKLINIMNKTNSDDPVYPLALCHYGKWLAETKSENPVRILEEYLQRATSLMELQKHDHLIHGYLTLARFADLQYTNLTQQMESKIHEAKRQILQESKEDLKKIKLSSGTDKAILRYYSQLQGQNKQDELVLTQQIFDQRNFLEIALTNYILCLRAGNEHDLRIFRVCSLWFSNSDEDLTSMIQEEISKLPSMKFIPLLYQFAARMSFSTGDMFQKVLQETLFKICTDHPHHSLYVVMALSNASLDNEFPHSNYVTGTRGQSPVGKRRKRSSLPSPRPNITSIDEDKVKAAKDLIGRLQSIHPVLVNNISNLCEAYVDLAYHDVSAYRTETRPIKLPPTCPILKTPLQSIGVPTMEIPIDPTCQYKNVVGIEKFDGYISLCGGVNLPKVISCLGSDGKRRRQLVKGRDDLRQDAVMQQVFSLVNRLLLKEPSTAKRKLSIRTYKVVPLSQCSGIVEWCEGTMPIGQYLIGTTNNPFEGAHSRYRPNDWGNSKCRKKFAEAKTKENKEKVFKEICCHFKPVFHHFFMETYFNPSLWFERRLAYTRNVAASSIVCYVVGLGDRHIQNILVDKETAELIHIDLGVAFEQGKTLPTPELIPFRLTRDLVDGMGGTGVDGVFRRCCEKTMMVMRSSQEELKTIVEVLLYDPLYSWSISPHKIQTLQGGTSTNGSSKRNSSNTEDSSSSSSATNNNANRIAERVLLRLQEKLEGIEDGTLLSIQGQVSHLIQEAIDPLKLSLLFHGWQPWV